jgi:(p)ppGpp synthase/HD superfamily hydrolase
VAQNQTKFGIRVTLGFKSSGIKEGLTWILGVEDNMGKALKNARLKKIEEINQCIQENNVDLRRLLQVVDDENQKQRLMLEKNVEEQVRDCSTTEEAKSISKIRPNCVHGRYTSYGSCCENVDSFTYC